MPIVENTLEIIGDIIGIAFTIYLIYFIDKTNKRLKKLENTVEHIEHFLKKQNKEA